MYFFGVFVRVSNFLSAARTPAPQNHSGNLSNPSLIEIKHTFSSVTFPPVRRELLRPTGPERTVSEPCQVSPPRTNCDVEVRDENQREIERKSVQLSQVIVRERDPYNQGKARSHQFSDEMAIPLDKIGMDVPVVRYPCRTSDGEGPPRQVHSADLTACHSRHL